MVLNNGGVPELPSALQIQLVASGPASLVSDNSHVQQIRTRTTKRILRDRPPSKGSKPRAQIVDNSGARTPGAAYMARTSSFASD